MKSAAVLLHNRLALFDHRPILVKHDKIVRIPHNPRRVEGSSLAPFIPFREAAGDFFLQSVQGDIGQKR